MAAIKDAVAEKKFDGAVDKIANEFGLQVYVVEHSNPHFSDWVKRMTDLEYRWPTLLVFDVNANGHRSDYNLRQLGVHPEFQNPDGNGKHFMWLPRRKGDTFYPVKSGESPMQHAVVVLGSFTDNRNGKWLLVADPNYPHPYLWKQSELDNAENARMKAYILHRPSTKNDKN